MLRIINHLGQQFIFAGASLADFAQINAIAGVNVLERAAERINRIG